MKEDLELELEWLMELEEVILWNMSFNISIEDSMEDMKLNTDQKKKLIEYLNFN